MSTESARYTEVARILHWLIAGLIVLNFILHELAEEAGSDAAELALWANHKSVGMTVLMLAVIRLLWRLTHKVPALPDTMPAWQQVSSNIAHFILYALIFIMPLSGWLYSSAETYSVSWFNLFVFPDLVWDNDALAEVFEESHEIGAKVLFVVALLHVAAAFKHALFDKDGVLTRMSSMVSVGLFVVAIAGGLALLNVNSAPAPATNATESTDAAAAEAAVEAPLPAVVQVDTTLPLWSIDYSQSNITFSAEQAGAPFTGTWPAWTAEIRFDPANPSASSAIVRVDVTKPATGDANRDGTLSAAEWFDSANHPEVLYRSIDITSDGGDAFRATGMLRIRNREYPVILSFKHSLSAGASVIEGRADLDRLALDLGTGEWADTTQVGQAVALNFKVTGAAAGKPAR